MSPDPLMASAHVSDPQTWNRYTYARNNPLKYIDPLGLFASPTYNCSGDNKACLSDQQRKILENSVIEGLSGEQLWNSLNQKQQNVFVNVTDVLKSVVDKNNDITLLDYVNNISDIDVDRIYVNASPEMHDYIDSNKGWFHPTDGSLHGEYGDSSFKYGVGIGNIQFSFADTERIDIDHDLFRNPVFHLFGEVVPNHLFDGINKIFHTNLPSKTNQDAIRKRIMSDPVIAITPSSDNEFNRKK